MDNNKIYERLKMRIAISNKIKEDIVMEKKKLNILKDIGIAACILLSMSGVVFATNMIVNKFGPNSSDGSQIAVENGYIANATENSIVDSFMLDNYNFYIAFNKEKLGLSYEDILQKYESRQIGEKQKEYLVVTNEKGEEVFNNTNTAFGLTEKDNKVFFTATAKEFPVSQKLYIDFDGRKEVLDVPENMQEGIVEYKLKAISDKDWKFEKATLSNTAFKIYLSDCYGFDWNDEDSVETSDGKKFYEARRSDGDGDFSVDDNGNVKMYTTFNLTKFDATNNLKVHLFKVNGEEVIIELEK